MGCCACLLCCAVQCLLQHTCCALPAVGTYAQPSDIASDCCRHNKHKHELFIYDDQTGDGAPKNGPRPAEEEEKLQHGQESVMFPGVNAPIPAGANPALWVRLRCRQLLLLHCGCVHNASNPGVSMHKHVCHCLQIETWSAAYGTGKQSNVLHCLAYSDNAVHLFQHSQLSCMQNNGAHLLLNVVMVACSQHGGISR